MIMQIKPAIELRNSSLLWWFSRWKTKTQTQTQTKTKQNENPKEVKFAQVKIKSKNSDLIKREIDLFLFYSIPFS